MHIELLTIAALIVVGGLAFVFGRFVERFNRLEADRDQLRVELEQVKAATKEQRLSYAFKEDIENALAVIGRASIEHEYEGQRLQMAANILAKINNNDAK